MKIEIRALEKNDESEWDRYVREHSCATFYHQIGWKRVIEETYGHKPMYLLARDSGDKICGVFPSFIIKTPVSKRIVSLPFAPYGDVCSNDAVTEKALLDAAVSTSRKLGINNLELRSLGAAVSCKGFRQMDGYYSTFILNLSGGLDMVEKNMSKNVRRGIKKSAASNLSFRVTKGEDAAINFFGTYRVTMSRLGTPPHGLAFFRNIQKQFPEDVYISEALYEGKTIASLFMMRFGPMLTSGYSTSLQQYFKLSPNNYTYWNSIRFAYENGMKYFDFGRSPIGSGVYQFKNAWGAGNVPLVYSYHPEKKMAPVPQARYGTFARLWKHIPLGMTDVLGPRVRKFIA